MKKFLFALIIISFPAFPQKADHSFYLLKRQIVEDASSSEIINQDLKFDDVKRKKSSGLAILYSMVLPGMGELYAGSYESGVYFTVADGVLWGTYIGMNVYANWQKDRYISYAINKAGINTNAKDETYYATISSYLNIDQYNNEKAFERDYAAMYSNQNIYYWKWNTNEERKEYRKMWSSSEQTFNNVRFVVGALILNRVVSAINAVRLVSKYNSNLSEEIGWNLSSGLQNMPDNSYSYQLNFTTNF